MISMIICRRLSADAAPGSLRSGFAPRTNRARDISSEKAADCSGKAWENGRLSQHSLTTGGSLKGVASIARPGSFESGARMHQLQASSCRVYTPFRIEPSPDISGGGDVT